MSSVSKRFWGVIKCDASRYVNLGDSKYLGSSSGLIFNAFVCIHHCLAFQFWLRLLHVKPPFPIKICAKIMYRRLRSKYGLHIHPQTTIGPGLYLGHGICIVINPKTVVGQNCSFSQFITIGSNHETPATIGDNVYIGPGVCIVEDVKIGNYVKIGAGTVVIHDIPDGATSVGNPNRIILK